MLSWRVCFDSEDMYCTVRAKGRKNKIVTAVLSLFYMELGFSGKNRL